MAEEPIHRWGFDRPVHARIADVLRQATSDYLAVLQEIGEHKQALHDIPDQVAPDDDTTPFWSNGLFSALDAAALVGLLLSRKPARYIEIGSGNSTKFARYAIRKGGLSTHVTSIDPTPQATIDQLCDQVIRSRLQTCDDAIFDELMPGDILFFDGSHRLATSSDVTVFFLEILPKIKPGVLVHLHDIYWPFDYLRRRKPNQWNEQYVLGVLLLCEPLQFKLILPNYFVCAEPELRSVVRDIFTSDDKQRSIPMIYADNPMLTGVSFWFETIDKGKQGRR